MLSSSDKFSAPRDSLWPQNDNAGYIKIPSQYRAVLSKYIDTVSGRAAKPIIDIAECKVFMDSFLAEFNAAQNTRSEGGRRRKYKQTRKCKHWQRQTKRRKY